MPLPGFTPIDTCGLRVALYARYSDRKKESSDSVDAQLALLRDFCAEKGWHVLAEYHDAGITGATRHRTGYQQLLDMAERGDLDVIMAEGLDRFTRDAEEAHRLFKRMEYARVKIITLGEGEVRNVDVALKGITNALYLEATSFKTRRSLRIKVERGEITVGRAYGYKVEPKPHPVTGRTKNVLMIDEEQAAIVVEIYAAYDRGMSPVQIARKLNDRLIPAPRGSIWTASTIRGQQKRVTGILRNPLYQGKMLWNRQQFVRNPYDDSKRIGRLNDAKDWIWVEVPHLRIVPGDLWERVQKRLAGISTSETATKIRKAEPWKHRKQHLLTGLAVCASCGQPLENSGKDYVKCRVAKISKSCSNTGSVQRPVMEAAVLHALQTQLLRAPELEQFIAGFNEALKDEHAEQSRQKKAVETELRKVRADLEGFSQTARRGMMTERLFAEMRILEDRETTIKAKLKAELPPMQELPPNLSAAYERRVGALASALEDEDHRHEARDIIRDLITAVRISFGKTARDVEVEIEGDIVELLELAAKAARPGVRGTTGLRERSCSVKVVAGA